VLTEPINPPDGRLDIHSETAFALEHRTATGFSLRLFRYNSNGPSLAKQGIVYDIAVQRDRAARPPHGCAVAQDLFGNRSAPGELATSRLLTVAETCDLQRLSILAYLTE
jgi:hypothetical protein